MGILANKIAIITGAGSGLGKAIAVSFAKEGATIVLCGRRKAKIEAVEQMIVGTGGQALAVQTDASKEADVLKMVSHVLSTCGRIDILVNNAAVFESGLVFETSLEAWNYQLENNLTSAFLMTKACLPAMRKQTYGRIINITSGLASNGAGGYAAYSASKAALESLTRTVAEEEAHYNILANLFSPGTVKSEMHATGMDPMTVTPDVVKLAALPKHGISGKLVVVGDKSL